MKCSEYGFGRFLTLFSIFRDCSFSTLFWNATQDLNGVLFRSFVACWLYNDWQCICWMQKMSFKIAVFSILRGLLMHKHSKCAVYFSWAKWFPLHLAFFLWFFPSHIKMNQCNWYWYVIARCFWCSLVFRWNWHFVWIYWTRRLIFSGKITHLLALIIL